jgi:hypothetical protein
MKELFFPDATSLITNASQRAIAKEILENIRIALEDCEYLDETPEYRPHIVYFEAGDDFYKGVPYLPDEDRGMLCAPPCDTWFEAGDAWESVVYHAEARLFEVCVAINDSLSIMYLIPEVLSDVRLLNLLKEKSCN